jgi:pilus assembly protein CpaF
MSVGMQSGMIRGNPGESNWVSRLFQANDRLEHQELKFTLHRKLLERVNLELLATIDTDSAREDLRVILSRLVDEEKTPLSMMEKERVTQEVLDEVFGLGPLEPLLQDRSISDILVTTPYLVVVERNGRLERTSVQFKDNAHLLRIIEKIVSRVGRRVDESSPMVDARLPDGSRVNAIIPPLAVDGPLLSIRRFGRSPLTPDKLIANHSVTPEMIQLLHACVRARLNMVISGGTGSGKTTLLNALSSFIPETERIVTIEDAAELQLNQWHVARLETRPPNVEGKGAIRQRELVINALRMRPDRIVVGETRGEEAIDMLQAMNTGHDGSLTTIHANSPRDGLGRLEVMVGMANANMGVRAIRQQIASAVDVIIQVSRMSDGTRRVTHITECVGMEGEQVTTQDIFNFIKTGISQDGRVLGRFQPTGVRPRFYEKLVTSGMHLPASVFETVLEIV